MNANKEESERPAWRRLKIALWLMAFTLLTIYHHMYSFDNLLLTAFVSALVDVGALKLCSLVINRVMVPRLLHQKKILWFVLLFMPLCISTSLLLQYAELGWYAWQGELTKKFTDVFMSFRFQVFNSYLPQFLGATGIFAFRLFSDYWTTKIRFEALQQEKTKAELEFLKAQLNPHFLFNSLNSLYAVIQKTNPAARELLIKFSDLLRYQLYECSVNEIEIEKEALYIQNYVSLESLRKNDYLNIEFEQHGLYDFKIAPLLLIPFVENAFKYASNHEQQSNSVRIHITYNKHVLTLYTYNTKDKVLSRELNPKEGIGIKNVKRRLELLYPGNYTLNINDNDVYFEVELKITLL